MTRMDRRGALKFLGAGVGAAAAAFMPRVVVPKEGLKLPVPPEPLNTTVSPQVLTQADVDAAMEKVLSQKEHVHGWWDQEEEYFKARDMLYIFHSRFSNLRVQVRKDGAVQFRDGLYRTADPVLARQLSKAGRWLGAALNDQSRDPYLALVVPVQKPAKRR